MKKEQNKFQDKSKKSEIEKREEVITSTETEDEIIETEPEEILVDEEPEQDEEIQETGTDEEIQDDELPPNLQEKKTDTQLKPETKSETENAELSNKQKIKALKRAIENKKYSLDRETEKCRTWRVQAKDRDEKATNEYQKRKKELEELAPTAATSGLAERMAAGIQFWRRFDPSGSDVAHLARAIHSTAAGDSNADPGSVNHLWYSNASRW